MTAPYGVAHEDPVACHRGSDWRILFWSSRGMLLIENASSNAHDKSLEAAMTGAFVSGPLMAITAVVVVLIYQRSRSQ